MRHDFLEDEIEEAEARRRSPQHGREEVVGDGFKPLAGALARVMETAANFREIGGNCDSPIEEELGAEILTYFAGKGHPLKLSLVTDARDATEQLLLVPQFKWSIYRSDWAIVKARPGATALLIECDGKDFHSSPEQRAHDARKDAAAAERGHLTVRFTGSRIFRSPKWCAAKVFEATGL